MRPFSHLNALRALEASIRHGSFTEAAIELAVTPAAVGQQVRQLEAYLGISLLQKQAGEWCLSEAAQACYPALESGFAGLKTAWQQLQNTPQAPIRLTLPPSLAQYWLLPLLPEWHLRHNTEVQLTADGQLADLTQTGFDFAIRYGAGHYPGLAKTLLFREQLLPVYSPSLALRAEQDGWQSLPLIVDDAIQLEPGNANWAAYHRWCGTLPAHDNISCTLNSSLLAMQAAQQGMGVWLARSVMAKSLLQTGQLLAAVGPDLQMPAFSYYLLQRHGQTLHSVQLQFRQWLLEKAAQL